MFYNLVAIAHNFLYTKGINLVKTVSSCSTLPGQTLHSYGVHNHTNTLQGFVGDRNEGVK